MRAVFSRTNAAERRRREIAPTAAAWRTQQELGRKEIPICATPASHPTLEASACAARHQPPPKEKLSQCPEQDALWGQVGYKARTHTHAHAHVRGLASFDASYFAKAPNVFSNKSNVRKNSFLCVSVIGSVILTKFSHQLEDQGPESWV